MVKAEDVGFIGVNLVLGKHSGRHAIRSRVVELGYQLRLEAQLQQVYDDFIALADKKKNVYDADIVALIDNRMTVSADRWKLVQFHITAGTGTIPTATVELRDESTASRGTSSDSRGHAPPTYRDAAIGDGPVDAVCKAMERIVGITAELKDYQVRAVSGGEDACKARRPLKSILPRSGAISRKSGEYRRDRGQRIGLFESLEQGDQRAAVRKDSPGV